MIQYLWKNNFELKSLELGSKGRKSGERANREGEGVPNSRSTAGEGQLYLKWSIKPNNYIDLFTDGTSWRTEQLSV
jgi:hypothetical protein